MRADSRETRSHWLRLAIQSVAGLDANSVLMGAAPPGGARPLRAGFDAARALHRDGLHQHDAIEIAITLSGHPTMALAAGVYAMDAARLAILTPGVRHSEGFQRRRDPYALLWLHYCSDSSLIAVVSQYQPATGWQCPDRYALRFRAVRQLLGKLSGRVLDSATLFEPVRADLLAILVELHRRAVLGAAPKTAGKARQIHHQEILQRVQEFLDHNFTKPIDVRSVAALTRLTPNYLNSLFSQWKGQGIHEYLMARRLLRAMQLCRDGKLLVKEIAQSVGYADPLYFSRAFRRYHGCWPTAVRPAAPVEKSMRLKA